jgi:hypothetical protein
MGIRHMIINIIKKVCGVLLILLSLLFFGASFVGVPTGEYGPMVVGFVLSFFLFVSGLMLLPNVERNRERILSIFQVYFPKCPICKTTVGYRVKGLIPTSQYVKCKHCGAEWASPDFVNALNLTVLKLWNPPVDVAAYRDFNLSGIKLQLRKAYSINFWQAYMNGQPEMPESKPSLIGFQVTDTSTHKLKTRLSGFSILLIVLYPILSLFNAIASALVLSVGASLLLTAIGFYGFSVSKENSYILFWAALFAVLFGLLGLPAFIGS